MTYTIALPRTGLGGWRLLNSTAPAQQAIIAREPGLSRAHAHLREQLPRLGSAEAFVQDYRLMRTTLEAFGLEGDLRNKAFIHKVISSDLADPKSLANRLSDKRYLSLAKALQLGPQGDTGTPAKETRATPDDLIRRHISAVFEARVGDIDGDLRLALNARRELAELASSASTDATKWYTIIGSRQLRAVVGGAFGFPRNYEKLPIDRQLTEFRAAAQKMFGTKEASSLSDPDRVEKLIERFLVRAQVTGAAATPTSAALTLLAGY